MSAATTATSDSGDSQPTAGDSAAEPGGAADVPGDPAFAPSGKAGPSSAPPEPDTAPSRLISSRLPAVLRRPDFRRYWLGQSVSLVGDEVHRIAMPLAAVLLFGAGATGMAWLTAAPLIPSLLLSIPAGVWADRRASRREIMLVADLGRFVAVASIPVAYAFGVLTLAQLIVSALIIGTLQVFFNVASNTLFAAMVPAGELVPATALTNGSRAFAFFSGPSLGGLLVQVFRAPFALVADAVSYLASAFTLGRISPVEPAPEERRKGGYLSGLRWVVRTPGVRAMQGTVACLNLFDFVFQALFVLYAVRHLHISAGVLGLVLGAGAIGGLAGAALCGRVVARLGFGAGIAVGCVGFAAPHVLAPLAAGPKAVIVLTLFAMEFCVGFGGMILDISAGAYLTAVMPDTLRSRISGVLQTVNYGIRPIGALLGGWLASVVGIRDTLWISAIGSTLAVLFILPSPLRTLRELPGALPG
ncbi:MFS transporter [Catenulispora subtropica]|uniref:MFS transporter n=1 Tax=Catenulispora subtropica TaxID=450798 RepID=A0ABP5ETM6_9ACTN